MREAILDSGLRIADSRISNLKSAIQNPRSKIDPEHEHSHEPTPDPRPTAQPRYRAPQGPSPKPRAVAVRARQGPHHAAQGQGSQSLRRAPDHAGAAEHAELAPPRGLHAGRPPPG